MIKTMTAKFKGRDAHTGAPIYPGDQIKYDTATRRAWIDEPGDCKTYDPYTRYQSNIFTTASAELYRNKRGRCEDAPCCGCCNF